MNTNTENSTAPEGQDPTQNAETTANPATEATPSNQTGDQPAAAPAEIKTEMVAFVIGGSIQGKTSVPVGTKVKDAIKAINPDAATSTLTLRDLNGDPVGVDRQLKEDLSVTSVKKASGG